MLDVFICGLEAMIQGDDSVRRGDVRLGRDDHVESREFTIDSSKRRAKYRHDSFLGACEHRDSRGGPECEQEHE